MMKTWWKRCDRQTDGRTDGQTDWTSHIAAWSQLKMVYLLGFNSLALGEFECNFRYVIFQGILLIDSWGIACEIALIWMSVDFTDDQSTFVQVMIGAVRQQAITWTNVDPDLWHHMASLGHNELRCIITLTYKSEVCVVILIWSICCYTWSCASLCPSFWTPGVRNKVLWFSLFFFVHISMSMVSQTISNFICTFPLPLSIRLLVWG